MQISIEKVSNGFVIKKYATDEFREEDTVMVAISFKDVVALLKDSFYGENKERDWDAKVPNMTKD
jgi:hypothetical protein